MTTALTNSLKDVLDLATVADLLKIKSTSRSKVIDVKASTPINEAIKILAENDILCALVRADDSVDYIGVLDVLDVLGFILKSYSTSKDSDSMQWSSWCTDIDELKYRGETLGAIPISQLTAHKLPAAVYQEGSIFQLIEVFAQGVHRVPVWRVSGHLHYVSDIVTQSDVINFLFRHRFDADSHGFRLHGDLFNSPIKNLGLGYETNVITMSYSAQAIHAFWLMYFNKVHGVAITDHNGKLIANLSASDIRGIGHGRKKFSALLLPIPQFFREFRIQTTPLICTPDTTFGSIIMKLGFYRVHRLWVVDAADKPIGLISLTDVMKFLASFEKFPQ